MIQRVTFKGVCNGCGRCCTSLNGQYRCEHLAVSQPIGQPDATKCRIYADRVNGMDILMLPVGAGEPISSRCYKDSVEEDIAIVWKGLGQGCSLEFA